MKTILVPIDFSPHSDNALDFACQIALNIKAEIYLFTIQSLPASEDANLAIELINAIEDSAKQKLNNKVADYKMKFKEVSISSHFAFGIPSLTIKEFLAAFKFDMVIMGTRGTHGIGKILFGSMAESISQHSPCPVLIIHEANRYESIKQIAVPVDLESQFGEMHAMIQKIGTYAKMFNAKLNFFNVHVGKEKLPEPIQFLLENGEPIKIDVIHSDSIHKGIEQYCDSNSLDLLILAKHNHTFVKQLFSRNVFGEILQNKSLPIMVFQYS